jgi:trk system potassium uptake protein TrkA
MKVIVMGCGRVGSSTSLLLTERGHDVTVIDHRDVDALARLGTNFRGTIIHGLGFDQSVLLEAGIKTAEAFVAASSSDNANIVAARIARNIFHVPRVVARMYDPRHAEIYQRLGLMTISSTDLGVRRIYELITHAELDAVFRFGRGEVTMVEFEVPYPLVGRTVRDLNIPGELNVATITRKDRAFIPTPATEFQEGDFINLIVLSSAMGRLEDMLGMERRA